MYLLTNATGEHALLHTDQAVYDFLNNEAIRSSARCSCVNIYEGEVKAIFTPIESDYQQDESFEVTWQLTRVNPLETFANLTFNATLRASQVQLLATFLTELLGYKPTFKSTKTGFTIEVNTPKQEEKIFTEVNSFAP